MTNGAVLLSWRALWGNSLHRFLKQRVRSGVDIEDLAQETYLKLLRAPNLGEVRNPKAYLFTIASHVVTEWRHQISPAGIRVDECPDLLTDERTPELGVDAQTSQARLNECLTNLPSPLMRTTLLLRLRDDRSYAEIADALGITERQVRRYLERGYCHLRSRFNVGRA